MQTTTANATPASEKTSVETVASSTYGVKICAPAALPASRRTGSTTINFSQQRVICAESLPVCRKNKPQNTAD